MECEEGERRESLVMLVQMFFGSTPLISNSVKVSFLSKLKFNDNEEEENKERY